MEKTGLREIKKDNLNVVLTMETAVKGGSISIFCDGKLLDFHIGDKSVSGAEDLLPKMSELLKRNNISKSDIDLIAISNGPGSFTGIRIGIATALALQKSLGCKCYGFDLLKVLANKGCAEIKTDRIISAVSQGRNKICWFDFEIKNLNSVTSENDYCVSDLEFLIKYITKNLRNDKIVAVHADFDIYKALTDNKELEFQNKLKIINAGENLSAILGFVISNKNTRFEKPKPVYLTETNFIS